MDYDNLSLHLNMFQFYFASSKQNMDDMVKPEMKLEYSRNKWEFLENPDDSTTRRTPLKFKEEFGGVGIVSLSPKMYVGFTQLTEPIKVLARDILMRNVSPCDEEVNVDQQTEEVDRQKLKISTKGCSKVQNSFTPLEFLSTLKTQKHQMAVNKGFLCKGKNLYRAEVYKRGPDYLYKKRIVQACGIKTKMFPESDEIEVFDVE